MKLKDVIDIDGKLYQIIHVSDDGSFEAEPIGEVVAKGFTRPQDDGEMVEELYAFCDKQSNCFDCCFGGLLDCSFEDYDGKQLATTYRIMKENE
jgi:hypothetical protein